MKFNRKNLLINEKRFDKKSIKFNFVSKLSWSQRNKTLDKPREKFQKTLRELSRIQSFKEIHPQTLKDEYYSIVHCFSNVLIDKLGNIL